MVTFPCFRSLSTLAEEYQEEKFFWQLALVGLGEYFMANLY